MQILQNTAIYPAPPAFCLEIFHEKALFFDIETTGFSRTGSFIYLIGCVYRTGENLHIVQFFADCQADEKDVLRSFLDFTGSFTELISFNGQAFDLPFIKARCIRHHLSENLDQMKHRDIFRDIKPLKNLLGLDSYRQKSIENFLGVGRDDEFGGGELIAVYHEYEKHADKEALSLLLLHNYDDCKNMPSLLSVYAYLKICENTPEVEYAGIQTCREMNGDTGYEMIMKLDPGVTVPVSLSRTIDPFHMHISADRILLRIPVFCGEMRHYYADYRNYFYLPLEDRAVHKDLAQYVDKEHKQKCTPDNCYITKDSVFLPQPEVLFEPFFAFSPKDSTTCFELTEDRLQDKQVLTAYASAILRTMLK